jgi:hypothetical protein
MRVVFLTLNSSCPCVQFTVVLLLRHLVAMETVGAADQSFSLLTVSSVDDSSADQK